MKKHLVSAHDLNKDEAVLALDTAKELALISDRNVSTPSRNSSANHICKGNRIGFPHAF